MISRFVCRICALLVSGLFGLGAVGWREPVRGTQQSLAELLGAIQHPSDATARCRAAEAVAEYGETAVPALCQLLQHQELLVRSYACVSLSRIGPAAKSAVPCLIPMAANPRDPVRDEAVFVLECIGPAAAPAVTTLRKAIGEGDSQLGRRVINALGAIGSPEAIDTLIGALRGGDRDQRSLAVAALHRLGPKAAAAVPALAELAVSDADKRLCDEAWSAIGAVGRQAVDGLVPLLQHPRAEIRFRAALTLSQMGCAAAPAVGALSEALDDPDSLVRFWAAKALGQIGAAAQSATGHLVRKLHDPDANVRWQAVQALAKIDLTTATDEAQLAPLLRDPHPGVRLVAEALRSLRQTSPGPAPAALSNVSAPRE